MTTPGPLWFTTDYRPDGSVLDVRLVNRHPPSLAAITTTLLAAIDPRFYDPTTPDVLVFRADARYLVGDLTPDGQSRWLHRLPS